MTPKEIFAFTDARKTAFIGSVDEEGFPCIKAMLAPRERDGATFYFTTNTSSMRVAQSGRYYQDLKTESFVL